MGNSGSVRRGVAEGRTGERGAIISESHSWKIAGSPSIANAEPVNPGDIISIFGTGLGAVSNSPATRSAAVAEPLSFAAASVSASIGGIPAEVVFAGLAPSFVGLCQINAVVPNDAPRGEEVPLAGDPIVWNGDNPGGVNIVKDVFASPSGGVVLVGSLSRIGSSDVSLTDGGAAAWDIRNGRHTIIWKRRFNSIVGGSVFSWNSGAFTSDGYLVFVGSGSGGRSDCGRSACRRAAIMQFKTNSISEPSPSDIGQPLAPFTCSIPPRPTTGEQLRIVDTVALGNTYSSVPPVLQDLLSEELLQADQAVVRQNQDRTISDGSHQYVFVYESTRPLSDIYLDLLGALAKRQDVCINERNFDGERFRIAAAGPERTYSLLGLPPPSLQGSKITVISLVIQ